jgi:methionine--tRNA ligase beta chain
MISFDDFKKLDIRIGKIVKAEKVEESDKLVKLMVDLGEEELRQIIAGIAQAYPDVATLIGKEIPIVANLKPKTMLGHTSYGMLLAADKEGSPILLHPAEETPPGSIVK